MHFPNKGDGWLHPTLSALSRIWAASGPCTIILLVSLLWSAWRFKEEDLALSVVICWIEQSGVHLVRNNHIIAFMCGPNFHFFPLSFFTQKSLQLSVPKFIFYDFCFHQNDLIMSHKMFYKVICSLES